MVPTGGRPRHSQFSGVASQECFKRTSSQRGERGVATSPRGRVIRRKSTEIRSQRMITGHRDVCNTASWEVKKETRDRKPPSFMGETLCWVSAALYQNGDWRTSSVCRS